MTPIQKKAQLDAYTKFAGIGTVAKRAVPTLLKVITDSPTLPGKAIDVGLNVVFPGAVLYFAAKQPRNRWANIGNLVGGYAGYRIGKPFGLWGSLSASTILGGLGRNLGSTFD